MSTHDLSAAQPGTTVPRRTAARVAVQVLAGLLAAALAGLVAGLLARGLMRLAVLAAGGEPEASLGGTAVIVVFFAVVAAPGAVARAVGARRTSAVLLLLGVLFLASQAVLVAAADLGAVDLTTSATAAMVAIGLGFVAVIGGLGLLAWRFASRASR
ncbi:hypothetical protein [Isoptericola sp. NPDC057653]|uniref:hypothetical protein n=1 Tax=unclassified Isoptericola TaxID=2623355 RepID=UPI0036BD6FDC